MKCGPATLNMARKKSIQDIKLSAFPEEVDKQAGVKVYGETSYENMLAVLSQYLHNGIIDANYNREEIVSAILDFLERKKSVNPDLDFESSREFAFMAAENPTQYDLFSDFFNVPFPNPKQGRFSLIDLFAGIGGIRLPFNELGYRCVFSSEWD